MSGYVGDLSASQQDALDRFRKRVSDVTKPEHTDHFLLRWLRAREFDEVKAEHMLRESMSWRKKVGADTIINDYQPSELFLKHFPGGFLECSPEGHPCYLLPIGSVDIKGFLELVPADDIKRHTLYLLESIMDRLKRSSTQKNKVIETVFFIADFENFTLRQIYSWQVVTLLTDMLKAYEDNYPEILEKAYVINAPRFFPLLWKFIRPFLTQRTVEKVAIYGTDDWKKGLMERLDPDYMPQHWGGSMVGPDGDPRCPHLVCPGGEVPASFREELAKRRLSREAGVSVQRIERRSHWELPMRVTRPGEQLSWSFQTATGDLSFGIRYEPPLGSSAVCEYLIEPQRLPSCSMVAERGRLVCDKPGTYVLEFDNSYSWVNSKTLAYIVEVLPPQDENELDSSSL
ncbi:SEC14-like protein 2 isoform X1 [Dermacentor silvarum]|uniref:SEC14-like protein 2 isoform X1 n=1 Tax=Dermacentor silvarum TaxID=543639 RepID=UPI00189751F0|nr:SEC14-like protein 2 isoform X1 [Dermacentor silvarum]